MNELTELHRTTPRIPILILVSSSISIYGYYGQNSRTNTHMQIKAKITIMVHSCCERECETLVMKNSTKKFIQKIFKFVGYVQY